MSSNGPDDPTFPEDTSLPDQNEHGRTMSARDRAAEEEAFARLEAADPAAGVTDPDLTQLRARVLDAVAADAAQSSGADATATAAPAAGVPAADVPAAMASAAVPATRGRHRGRVWLAAAAAAAVLLGVAAAGAAWGRASAPATTAGGPYPVAVLGAAPGAAGGPAAAGAAGPEAAVGTAPRPGPAPQGAPAVGTADAKLALPYGGRVILRGGALPDTAGTATGYRFDAGTVDRQALARTLAAAFGIDGQPVADGSGAWTVGLADGTGASLTVGSDGLASWYVGVPKAAPYYCPAAVEPAPAPGATTSGGGAPDASAPVPCATPTGPALAEDAARERAQRYLAAAGIGTGGLEWTTRTDGTVTEAIAAITADGRRTGMTMSFSYGPGGGLFAASGMAATLVPVPGYPVVGARTAVERTLDPRWGTLGPTPLYPEGGPVPMAAAGGPAVGAPAAEGSGSGVAVADAAAKAGEGATAGTTATPDGATSAGSATSAGPATSAGSAVPASGPASGPTAPTKDGRPVLVAPMTELTAERAEPGLTQYWQQDGTVLLLPAYVVTATDGTTWSVLALGDEYVSFVPVG